MAQASPNPLDACPPVLACGIRRRLRLAHAVGTLAGMLIAASCVAQQSPPSTVTPQGREGTDATALKPAFAPPLRVVVSIAPIAGLVEPLARAVSPDARVVTLVPPGVSEHGYEPTPAQLSDIARADLIVLVGLGLEPAVERAIKARPRLAERTLVLSSLDQISHAPAPEPADHDHEATGGHDAHAGHEHSGDCDHAAGDPHFWLDPLTVRSLVPALRDALAARLRPIDASTAAPATTSPETKSALDRLNSAASKLEADLLALDRAYAEALAPYANRHVVVGHDAYAWLARRYNLKMTALAGLNASEPTPAALAGAARTIRERALTCVYVEPQLSRAAGERIATATGASVRQLDPLGAGDYFALMRTNLDALLAGFRAAPLAPATTPKAP